MTGRLAGKAVVVTGAAGGIGAACVATYCREGASVLAVDVDERVEESARELAAAGASVAALVADISTLEGNRAAVESAERAFGGLDGFHANAAAQVMARAEDTDDAAWERMQSTNLRGPFHAAQAALPAFRRRRGGSLLFTASVLGLVGDPDLPAYGAMKGGLRALCRSLATAHGPENVRVNTICPGDVETPMVSEYFAFQPDPDAARAVVTDRYPLRRFAQPEEVAAAAAFLLSDDAAYISGIDLIVDGGLLARIY
jgi:NAD(P)-dependent dehydrogenase (short-subunit alcohol dehydrogenase family)